MPSAMPHVRSGKLRGIAVTSIKRSALVPDLPTVAENGLPGYEMVAWQGLLAPKATPPALIQLLNREMVAIVQAAGGEKAVVGRRRRAHRQHTGRVRALAQARDSQMDEGREGSEHTGGMIDGGELVERFIHSPSRYPFQARASGLDHNLIPLDPESMSMLVGHPLGELRGSARISGRPPRPHRVERDGLMNDGRNETRSTPFLLMTIFGTIVMRQCGGKK